MEKPTMQAHRLEPKNAEQLELRELHPQFSGDCIRLEQAWRASPEPDLCSTEVRVSWQPEALFLFVRLEDRDITSRSTGYNQRLWELGDAFECFLQLEGEKNYYEFHVSPNNHVMQLRLDSTLSRDERERRLADSFMPNKLIESRVWIDEAQNQWHALMKIPHHALERSTPFAANDQIAFSFSRYDAARNREEPVLSSSSNHSVLDFHRREDWGTLRLS